MPVSLSPADVPVFAYKSTAVPETMGEGGLLFTDKRKVSELAVAARLLMHDHDVQRNVLAGQKRRRGAFLPGAIKQQLDILVGGMNG